MKIALIVEHFDASRGASEHLAVWVAGELSRRGHEVHVLCHDVTARINRYRQATLRASHDADRSHRAHPLPQAHHEGLHIHRLEGVRLHTALGFRLFGVRARHWCRRHRPDVVHSLTAAFAGDVYHPLTGVYAAMQAQVAASRPSHAAAQIRRMILRLPGKQRTLLILERRALLGTPRHRPARIVLSPCAMTTRQFAQYYPAAARRVVELIPPRMELGDTAPLAPEEAARRRAWFRAHYRIADDDRVALFVGHDFRRKGLAQAVEAIARTRTRWKLLVVGLGRARPFVEKAAALGLGPATDASDHGAARVMFVGPTRQMSGAYATADAVLLPVFYESSNLVVMEALSHGLPVISTGFLGAAELVSRHAAGTIVSSPLDIGALAAALDSLPAVGTAERLALAERARSASQSISPDSFMEILVKLYRQVQAQRAGESR